MAISVAVPKNLSGIKTKVAMNLTKRQLICFGAAGAVGIPLYLYQRYHWDTGIRTDHGGCHAAVFLSGNV